jgi:putative transposase
MQVFFQEDDYELYLQFMKAALPRSEASVLTYCLMPNHVHFLVLPDSETSLRRLFAETHRRYSLEVNSREGWSGHLWQERFYSCPVSLEHAIAASRYIELNPVQAGLVESPFDYRWSSAVAHRDKRADSMVDVLWLGDLVGDWRAFLASGVDEGFADVLERHEQTGRPLGPDSFVDELEARTGRRLKKLPPGPKR